MIDWKANLEESTVNVKCINLYNNLESHLLVFTPDYHLCICYHFVCSNIPSGRCAWIGLASWNPQRQLRWVQIPPNYSSSFTSGPLWTSSSSFGNFISGNIGQIQLTIPTFVVTWKIILLALFQFKNRFSLLFGQKRTVLKTEICFDNPWASFLVVEVDTIFWVKKLEKWANHFIRNS